MSKINLELVQNKKYVVACSFGPDSMALLSSAIENGLQVVVAHVNYRKRDASSYEQKALEEYCKDRNIPIYVLDLKGVESTGNFQEWAREKRYIFFKEVLLKENAEAVLVAHQQDDLIETYLMQKNRGNFSKFAGISGENELFGIKILRPLLAYSKQYLQNYDDENNVPYSIDETNLKDDYTRNKFRHNVVEKMTEEERKAVLEEIVSRKEVIVPKKTVWGKEDFLNLTYEQLIKLLDFFMNKTNEHSDLSQKFVSEIKKAFQSDSNCYFDITGAIRLEKDYDSVYLVNKSKLKEYCFAFDKQLHNDFFDIDFSAGAEDRKIIGDCKDMIIKNIKTNTEVIIKDYSSNINRLYIDWKMPHYLREVWPGIYNKNGELLYVPRYRKKFEDNHKSKFVFRTEYFTEF